MGPTKSLTFSPGDLLGLPCLLYYYTFLCFLCVCAAGFYFFPPVELQSLEFNSMFQDIKEIQKKHIFQMIF